jgi:preprotein translocase subunit SecD
MKAFIHIWAVALVLNGWNSYAEGTNAQLTFHIISEAKIDGGRFIDTPALPKVGYIGSSPDLTVTRLREVFAQKEAGYAITGETNGTHRVVPSHPPRSLAVQLQPEDAKRFEELTERALNKRLLVMFGGEVLSAPWVRAPIGGGSFTVSFHSEAELKKTENGLKKLIQ